MIMRDAPMPGSSPGYPPGRNPYDVLPSLDAPFSPPPPVVAHVTQPTPPPSARGGYAPSPSTRGGTTPPPPNANPNASGGYPQQPYPFQSAPPPQVQRSQMPLPPGVPPTAQGSVRPPGIPQTMRPVSAFPSAMRRSSRPPANLPLPSQFLPPQQQAPGSVMIPALLLGGPLVLAMLVIAVLALA